MRRGSILAALVVGAGCAASPGLDDGGSIDAARAADGGVVDAAPVLDDGGVDAGPLDAGPGDAGFEQPIVHGEAPPLARLGECGRLSYGLYANQGQSEVVNRIPDFSHAGYRGGGVPLPHAEVVLTLDPADGDDRERIQAAIDGVSALPRGPDGLRGAVLLRAGTYQVGDTLTITASGVVLRGEGQGTDGTVLVATRREKHSLIVVRGEGGGFGEVDGTRVAITSPRVPVGERTFTVESSAPFTVGDTIAVRRTPNATWIDDLGMAPYGWTPGSYSIPHERVITAIDGDQITVDIPIVDTIQDRYGGGVIYRADFTGRIEQVGIEDLRLDSEYSGSTDESHGWTGVALRRTTHSWVHGVTVTHFGYAAVSIGSESDFNTVEECAMRRPVSVVTGSRRYSFEVDDGVGNLFQRCYSERARHDFVTGSRVTGPNVWLDCFSTESSNDDGPHHRWATGLLFDNTYGYQLHVENRTGTGTGHGWSGAQVMFWNAFAGGIRCDAPRGAMSWAVGCVGSKDQGGWAPGEPFGIWERHNDPVAPRSLYLQQLRDRLGPEAVDAVTIPEQREGRIWGLLAGWGGQSRLEDATPATGDRTCETGIRSGNTCCAASCGSCGGSGCGSRPGGASSCCTSDVRETGRSCEVSRPPCVL